MNSILLAMTIYFGYQIHGTWTGESYALATGPADTESPDSKMLDPIPASRRETRVSAYQVASEKNLFSPDRRGPEPETTAPEPTPQVHRPPEGLGLFGVLLAGKDKRALIGEGGEGDNQRGRWVMLGDNVRGYTVVEIEKDSITLTSSGRSHRISLYDRRKRRVSMKKPPDAGPTVIHTDSRPESASSSRPLEPQPDPEAREGGRKPEKQPEKPPAPPSTSPTHGDAKRENPPMEREAGEPEKERSPKKSNPKAGSPADIFLRSLQ